MPIHGIDRGPQIALGPLDGERLWTSLERASEIGRWHEHGVQRLALTDADREMRDTFCAWCRDSGLRVWVDQAGNIHARRDGAQDVEPVMVGSHLDTQVAGGRYDGTLGVLAGLETMRWLDDHALVTRRPVELVAWSNEEGARFQPPMLGSAAYTGALALTQVLEARDCDGATFAGELERIGYAGTAPLPGPAPAAYFELHIEQSDVLDRAGIDLGIVTASYTSNALTIRVAGETGHAGATPMRRRHDALVGAAEIVTALDAIAREGGDEARATTARLDVWPNRPGITAGSVTLTADLRHARAEELAAMRRRLDAALAGVAARRELEVAIEASWEFGAGISFDETLASLARDAAAALGVQTIDMSSTAGHDAYSLAAIAPTLILFVPCVDGITHNEHEQIEFERVLQGANVLARSVLEAAGPMSEGEAND